MGDSPETHELLILPFKCNHGRSSVLLHFHFSSKPNAFIFQGHMLVRNQRSSKSPHSTSHRLQTALQAWGAFWMTHITAYEIYRASVLEHWTKFRPSTSFKQCLFFLRSKWNGPLPLPKPSLFVKYNVSRELREKTTTEI